MLLRVYAVAKGDSYEVLPGGLSRVAGSMDSLFVSPKRGGTSKDTWVLADGPIVATASVLQQSRRALTLSRNSPDQHPSRVADNIYWLGRYVERVDSTVRLLRAIFSRAAGDFGPDATPELPALLAVLADLDLIPTPPHHDDRHLYEEFLEQELIRVVYDESRLGSLKSTLTAMRRTAWIVRDRLSADSWRILHRVENELPPHDPKVAASLSDIYTHITQLVLNIAGFNGLAMESMTRGLIWRFLDIGRRIERSINMLHLLKATLCHHQEHEAVVLQAVLEVADSSMTYRYRYLSTFQVDAVLDLLMTDESNPRSLAYQLANLAEHVEALPRERTSAQRSEEQKLMLEMTTRLRLADMAELCELDDAHQRPALKELIDQFLGWLPNLSDALSRTYFSHTEPVRQLGDEVTS
jgi:uncharacterized alpha-E superfamily protein